MFDRKRIRKETQPCFGGHYSIPWDEIEAHFQQKELKEHGVVPGFLPTDSENHGIAKAYKALMWNHYFTNSIFRTNPDIRHQRTIFCALFQHMFLLMNGAHGSTKKYLWCRDMCPADWISFNFVIWRWPTLVSLFKLKRIFPSSRKSRPLWILWRSSSLESVFSKLSFHGALQHPRIPYSRPELMIHT